MGHPRVIIVVITYCGGFSTSKNGSFWHLLVVQVYLISNSHDSPLFKLLYGCYMDSHGFWLVVLGLMALSDSISVCIGPSPREREKEERKDRGE